MMARNALVNALVLTAPQLATWNTMHLRWPAGLDPRAVSEDDFIQIITKASPHTGMDVHMYAKVWWGAIAVPLDFSGIFSLVNTLPDFPGWDWGWYAALRDQGDLKFCYTSLRRAWAHFHETEAPLYRTGSPYLKLLNQWLKAKGVPFPVRPGDIRGTLKTDYMEYSDTLCKEYAKPFVAQLDAVLAG